MLSGVSEAAVGWGWQSGPFLSSLPKHMASVDFLVIRYWTFPAGSPAKRINGLLLINRDHKILMRASWMKIRVVPRARWNDFNLSGSTSHSFAETLMKLKHLTPESNKKWLRGLKPGLRENINSNKALLITLGEVSTQADYSLMWEPDARVPRWDRGLGEIENCWNMTGTEV